MKGILLAGGNGTRLYPTTSIFSKHLMTIYDKPMIFYSLSILMMAGIREILVITTKSDIPHYTRILGDGSHLGIHIQYRVQDKPEGIAQAFIIGEDFINHEPVCLVLGDNIFYGHGLAHTLQKCTNITEGAVIFGYWVKDPSRYGVIEYDQENRVIGIEEKPIKPKSNFAIPGIYFYDGNVVEMAKKITPSDRGELEITDVNLEYLKEGQLTVELMGRGMAWLDTGTPDSLLDAANFVATVDRRQGLKIACVEEISYRMGFIKEDQLRKIIDKMPQSEYRIYLEQFERSQTPHVRVQPS